MTTVATATGESLLTAEEYAQLRPTRQPSELLRGRVVLMNAPYPRHGEICATVARLLGNHVHDHHLGRIVTNDAGVITARNPDTVRGADIAFYSYEDQPQGPLPQGYLPVLPRLVIEVFSPTDRWAKVLIKVGEYLDAGVRVVCVLDEAQEEARLYRDDRAEVILQADEELTLPDVLGDFSLRVERFFEA